MIGFEVVLAAPGIVSAILFASKSFISIINITTPLMMDSCLEFYNSLMFALSQLYAKYIIFIST